MACSFRASVETTASSSAWDHQTAPVPVAFAALRRSITSTGGMGLEPTRSGRRSNRSLLSACTKLSSDGVALPSIRRAPSKRARTAATSRVL